MKNRGIRILLWSVLSVIGFVAPNAYVASYFREHGLSVATARRYFAEWGRSTPTRALTADLGITVAAFWAWSARDAKVHGVRHWWAVPAATGSVGICFAVPLYYLLRELADTGQ